MVGHGLAVQVITSRASEHRPSGGAAAAWSSTLSDGPGPCEQPAAGRLAEPMVVDCELHHVGDPVAVSLLWTPGVASQDNLTNTDGEDREDMLLLSRPAVPAIVRPFQVLNASIMAEQLMPASPEAAADSLADGLQVLLSGSGLREGLLCAVAWGGGEDPTCPPFRYARMIS